MRKIRSPCYQCPRRASGCHDRCEEFAAWRAGNQIIADARRANEHAERDIEVTKKKYRRA